MPQATPAAAKKEATKTATKPAPTHATSGVVKSVDDSTLVITKGGKKPEDMTFMLNANTHKEGAVAAGAPVSVRYHEDGKTHVATAVTVEQREDALVREEVSRKSAGGSHALHRVVATTFELSWRNPPILLL